MKMRDNQRWPDFLVVWCNKLTEARREFWDDRNEISMLQAALRDRPTNINRLNHNVENQQEPVEYGEVQVQEQVGQVDSSGNTIMGGVHVAGLTNGAQRRAKWKSLERLDRLRR
ncbi:hypothetical protein EV44_g2275 [Erysiphe necator]|uniref:Uncharacterized protein n=1 Tax=Uncinula necator TaxID=52586 RepID=A0A0B1P466_UNCNE|nr:hypothetical protein EV44_g2275 [Erysiphe necator]